jgi:hypothetical protein
LPIKKGWRHNRSALGNAKRGQGQRDRGIDSESTFEVTDISSPQRIEIKGKSEPFRSAYEFAKETGGFGDGETKFAT